MITSRASGGLNAGEGNVAAVQEANAYCVTMKKFMVVRRIDNQGMAALGGETTSLIFSCVDENDPEYKRPDLRKEPGVIIQDQRQ
jgi:hypothetical protein